MYIYMLVDAFLYLQSRYLKYLYLKMSTSINALLLFVLLVVQFTAYNAFINVTKTTNKRVQIAYPVTQTCLSASSAAIAPIGSGKRDADLKLFVQKHIVQSAGYLPLLSILCGLTIGQIVSISKIMLLKLDSLRIANPVASPLLGSLALALLYVIRTDIQVGPTSIFSEDNKTFSFTRQIFRYIGSLVIVGSGNALGFAGPVAEFGLSIGRLFGLSLSTNKARRQLCLAGSAAAFAANFNAPLAGFAYSMELTNRQLSVKPLAADAYDENDPDQLKKLTSNTSLQFLAIISATLIIRRGSMISIPHDLSNFSYFAKDLNTVGFLKEIPFFVLLGFISGSIATIYRSGILNLTAVMFPINPIAKPLLGGFINSLYAFHQAPQSLFRGYKVLNDIIGGVFGNSKQLCNHSFGKLFAMMLSQSCGLVGGLVMPSFFAGSSIGILMYQLINKVLHGSVLSSPASLYGIVGAAGLLSAFIRAPLTATLLVLELTKQYDLALPLLLVTAISNRWTSKFIK